jgi:hypothetical protein
LHRIGVGAQQENNQGQKEKKLFHIIRIIVAIQLHKRLLIEVEFYYHHP